MKKCVLVVDDEIGIRRALARELRRTFDTRVADCGTAAVAEVADDVDLVLCDISLGRVWDGLRVLEAVRQRAPRAHRVLMSGGYRADDDLVRGALRSGLAEAFLAKPWGEFEARDVLARLLDLPA